MPEPLLPTKLIIPHTRPQLVTRSRLIEQLHGGIDRTLTLVSAPAGFGKTTLISEWVAQLQSAGPEDAETLVGWLSLDETDSSLPRFLTYFFTGLMELKGLDIEVRPSVLDMLQSPQPAPVEAIFTPLISDLTATRKKIVFILDDYHLIEDFPIHQAVNFWLENAPPQVHTVVITREDPPFPLARLRARGQMTEIRSADLRFTQPESTQFLNTIMGLQLDDKAVSLLEARTEGWIAGLQMAALSMQNRPDTAAFIENFSGTNRYILDYLLEEVLANQPPHIQEFLLRTSILKRISAPLCDALLRESGQAAEILGYLEQANLFLIPLDDERSWYRYHHLFADLLKARLRQTHRPEALADLHRRAAQWHEANRMTYGAIYHASLIPDDAWVERIIDQNYMEIFQRKDSASIRQWTGELGQQLIFKRPRLAIHEANSRAWFGQLEEADHLLDAAEKQLKAEPASTEVQAMFGYLDYVKSRVTAMRGDFEQAIALGRSARENTPESNQGLLGGIGVMLGYGYFLNGDFASAEQTLQETIQSGKRSGAINTTIGAYCVLARLYTLQGSLQKARALYREAEIFVQKSDGQLPGAMSIVHLGLAETLYEINDLEAARAYIQQGMEYLPLWSKADDTALAYVIYSKIEQAEGNFPAAERNIEKASQTVHTSGVFAEARDAVTAAKIEEQLPHADSLTVHRWAASLEKRLNDERPLRFENELLLITLARLYIAQAEWDKSLDLIAQLEDSARVGGRDGRRIKILALQAVALHKKGEQKQAFTHLERALALAEPESYVRTFIDEGEPVQQMLSQWVSQAEANPLRAFARQLIAQFVDSSVPGGQAPTEGKLIEPLSPRELEVLAQIALGKTNKEISAALIISPGTVKAHTSSIYRKLDVATRTEAVARARALELLP